MAYFWLTPPSRAVFLLSVLLAVLALLVRYAHIAIPVVSHYPRNTASRVLAAIGWQPVQGFLIIAARGVSFGRCPFVWPCKLMVKPRA